jgi:hypothetical protein
MSMTITSPTSTIPDPKKLYAADSFITAGDRAQPEQQEQAEECNMTSSPNPLRAYSERYSLRYVNVRLPAKEILELDKHECNEQDHDTSQHDRRFRKTKERRDARFSLPRFIGFLSGVQEYVPARA